MKEMKDNIQMAAEFVNSTSSHIYLTGKAGTGKTTFLKSLGERTHKRFVIVAPTGIAALNAGGVTIHSQFLLPLGTFLPDRTPSGSFGDQSQVYTQYTLVRKHPLNSARKQVLRSIDLLIIDEVSMLRADVLDAIDYRLRSARGNFRQSFGGVQVLMIGDLYQLPPIVKEHEFSYLKRYYHSAHFFEAKALQESGFVYIELDKIFRQSDNRFIEILNHLRDNNVSVEDIEELNRHYNNSAQVLDRVITLTTHNYKADDINLRALKTLPGASFIYKADIEDDFPAHIFPLPESLELKLGAQIMFIKNDSSGQNRYFNGKLAVVDDLDEDDIWVIMSDNGQRYKLEREEWENKKYQVNAKTKELDEEVIGKFSQYPVKLAWAVTVHKSQGLTFDKAIIDVGEAFAPGQVYVALSRLRSLDGLILKSKIDPAVINSDAIVVEFSQRKNLQPDLHDILRERQYQYAFELVDVNFDFSQLISETEKMDQDQSSAMEFEDESMRGVLKSLYLGLKTEEINTVKYRQQLKNLLASKDIDQFTERLDRGVTYYAGKLKEYNKILLAHIHAAGQYSGSKTYINTLSEIDQLLSSRIEQILRTKSILNMVMTGEQWTDAESIRSTLVRERNVWLDELRSQPETIRKSAKKSGKVKRARKEKSNSTRESTMDITLSMLRNGLSIEQIAIDRGLVVGTIESHLFKATEANLLKPEDWIAQPEIDDMTAHISKLNEEVSIADIRTQLNNKYSFTKIRTIAALIKGKS
jgi:GTPase SAR1 family protein/DNA-binding NarL/FixJ family response regulator